VLVPFTVNDIQQCRETLGKYAEDPDKFTIVFQILALEFDLSWRDVQFLLTNCCTPTESEKLLLLPIGRQMRPLLGIPQASIQGMSLSQQLSLTGMIMTQEECR
jgi:hypothetical protein